MKTSDSGKREYSDPSELDEPGMRLYLIEKGRLNGISGCIRGHRAESHGDVNYHVTSDHGDIKLVITHGSSAALEATSTKLKALSKLSTLRTAKKQLTNSIEQFERNPEVVAQLKERLEATVGDIERYDQIVSDCNEVPEARQEIKYLKS